MILAYIEWTSPAWGWALLAAAGVPLLAHLLSRKGGRLAVFPAVRFVEQATAECARLLRPRHWMLMALRILMAAAVVAAFARPVWFDQAVAAVTDRRGVDMVMILDASASMRRTAGGGTLFDKARREAAEALRGLDPTRDRAAIILLDGSPASLLPEMTANFSELAARLEQASPNWQQGDLLAAIRLANRPAAMAPGAPDEQNRVPSLHLLSDMQATQWPAEELLRQALANRPLTLHPVGQAEANLAIQSPQASPARPVVGQETAITANVANFSTQPIDATVQMNFADQAQTMAVHLAPNGKAAVRFIVRPTGVGPAAVRLRLLGNSDSLPADNQTGLYLDVAAASPVVLVTRSDTDNPLAGAFYLKRALAPAAAKNPVELQVLQPEKLSDRLGGAGGGAPPAVVVIVESGKLDQPALAALVNYIERGGGVLWIADGFESVDALGRLKDAGDGQVVSPIAPRGGASWDSQTDLPLEGAGFDNPILGVFEGPSRTGLLAQRFSAVMHGTLSPGSEQLVSFPRHEPALAARWAGAGRLAVLAAAIAPRESDLVKGPAFLPLIQQLIKGLAPGVTARPNPFVGSRPTLTIPGRWLLSDLRGRGPSGDPVGLTAVSDADGQTLVEIESTPEPGPYEVLSAKDHRLLAGVQVDLYPGESDMATQLRPPGLDAAAGGAEASGVALTARPRGLELWPYFILLALALTAAEMALLGLMTGPWSAPPKPWIKEAARA